ncbi:MAG TPA: divergent polysaccharide deacetylase family protein [Candidatus Acidoferrum sp.]|nr:divergent polysaccharide deacetylase family protein [Candidatus Acidoferrum sp.]
MRSAFWLAVIALALAAIIAGYVSGNATTPPALHRNAQPRVAASVHAVMRDPSDSRVSDVFAGDDVVIDRPQRATSRWLEPQLSIVVGLAGDSPSIDAAFMQTNVPIAFDIDPSSAQATDVAQLAREAGDVVLLHVERAPTQTQLAQLRKRFGAFDGLASRVSDGFVQSLDGTGLLFFDERGDADGGEFSAVGIPIVQRDATVDDRTARSYIHFMLSRVVQRSQLEGRSVVLMRPLAHSLDALKALIATRSVQFVPLTQR